MNLRRRTIHAGLLTFVMGVSIPVVSGGSLSRPPQVSGNSSQIASVSPEIAGCPIFPADNIWNVPVDTLPVDPNSSLYVATIGADVSLHADFGSGLYEGGPIGIPFDVVPASQPGVSVQFEYADESDSGPYPIPAEPLIEGGPQGSQDRHVLVIERDTCTLYELFDAYPQADGSWQAGSGAIFDLTSNALRPDGWTSADAAGLPIVPGLVRYEDILAGEIRHALRFTAPQTRNQYVWPARHEASDLAGAEYPPLGQRFRLRADFDVSGFSPEVQIILRALQTYGMMLADNGSPWYLTGAPDDRWDNDMLRELREVTGADFEAVDVSSLQIAPNSGQVATANAQPSDSAATLTALLSAMGTPTPAAATPPDLGMLPTLVPAQDGAVIATVIETPASADFYVDDDNTTGVEDGSAAAPYSTVQQAIDAASDGAVIAVAAGTYAENIAARDRAVRLYGGYLGAAAPDYASGTAGDFSRRDPTVAVTRLQGDGQDSVVTLINAGASVVDGFVISGGSRSLETQEYCCWGGGFYISGGAPTIANNVIENNDTRSAGGPDQEYFGGGIYAEYADTTILDNVIRNNTSGRGAGIAINGNTVVIRGNRIEGNVGVSDHGGGLYIFASTADISHNRIVGNEIGRDAGYGWGGGALIYGVGTVATLSYNVYTANIAPSVGSGLFVDEGGTATLDHELIYANACTSNGGAGVYVDGGVDGGSVVSITHTTIADHNCPDSGNGGNAVYVEGESAVTLTNSILWGNAGDDVIVFDTSTLDVTYTLSEEAIPGSGNLTADPLFADPASSDYHLRSTVGRWDAASGGAGAWVQDAQHSPAIDAGDPASPFDAEPEPNGGQANLGAYGNTPEASLSAR